MSPRTDPRLSSIRINLSLLQSARTALAATAALAVASLLRMPEPYWAPISAIIVMQSTLGAAWAVSKQRMIGTVMGTVLGAVLATYVPPHALTFGAAILALGLICAVLRLDPSAYRFKGVTLAIIFLVARGQALWLVGLHRFVEVSLGIAVSLVVSGLWPGPAPPKSGP